MRNNPPPAEPRHKVNDKIIITDTFMLQEYDYDSQIPFDIYPPDFARRLNQETVKIESLDGVIGIILSILEKEVTGVARPYVYYLLQVRFENGEILDRIILHSGGGEHAYEETDRAMNYPHAYKSQLL